MRRLTVLLVVSDLRIGGAERQLINLACGLDKDRFRVIVAALYAGQPFEHDIRDCAGVELHCLNRLGKFDFLTLFKLVRLLRREQVDVIQLVLTPATAFGMLAAIIDRTPVKIVTERSSVRLNTHFGNKLYPFFEDRLTLFADAVVPNSEAGRRYVRSRGIAREKVRVIYNGVAQERIDTTLAERQGIRAEYGVPDESWLIGIVASLTPANDHASFLQAASIVRAEVPGTKFILVGDGPLRSELMRRAAVLGINGSVIFAGHQMRVAPYIGAMDVAVLSSGEHEGCSNFLLEAMGLGRPIVATGVGGNEELFSMGEAGLIVPPSNPLILAHAILEIMRHPDAAERMQRRSREIFRQRFTLPTMIAEYEDLYADLWRGHKPKHSTATETDRAA